MYCITRQRAVLWSVCMPIAFRHAFLSSSSWGNMNEMFHLVSVWDVLLCDLKIPHLFSYLNISRVFPLLVGTYSMHRTNIMILSANSIKPGCVQCQIYQWKSLVNARCVWSISGQQWMCVYSGRLWTDWRRAAPTPEAALQFPDAKPRSWHCFYM